MAEGHGEIVAFCFFFLRNRGFLLFFVFYLVKIRYNNLMKYEEVISWLIKL